MSLLEAKRIVIYKVLVLGVMFVEEVVGSGDDVINIGIFWYSIHNAFDFLVVGDEDTWITFSSRLHFYGEVYSS